jgi:hypothetical protein
VEVDAPITAPTSGTDAEGNGCPGGSIRLGWTGTTSLGVHAQVTAGDGGPGRDSMVHTITAGTPDCDFSSNDLVTKGGSGGDGGSVSLDVEKKGLDLDSFDLLRAGAGGRGGDANATAAAGGPRRSGQNTRAFPGHGGDGGSASIVFEKNKVLSGLVRAGHGGRAGPAGSARIRAGAGGDPGCAGGGAGVNVEYPGKAGTGSIPPKPPELAVITAISGNASQVAPDQGEGGAGGGVELLPSKGKMPQPVITTGGGNGGPGANGCSQLPYKAGGKGGRSGYLSAYGLTAQVNGGSFDGGNGGDGSGPGDGGPGARPSDLGPGSAVGAQSFGQGKPGNPCAPHLISFSGLAGGISGVVEFQIDGSRCYGGGPLSGPWSLTVTANGSTETGTLTIGDTPTLFGGGGTIDFYLTVSGTSMLLTEQGAGGTVDTGTAPIMLGGSCSGG